MTKRRIRWLSGTTGVLLLLLAFAGTPAASADPPAHQELTFTGAVSDNGEACGFPVSWEFEGEVRLTRFVDSDGNVVRVQVHVREAGTVTNGASGEVVVLPRTAFLQRTLIVDPVTRIIQISGSAVRITGPDDFLMDVGRFVIRINPNELLQSSGQHPIREINPFSTSDPALLGAFCEVLS